MYPFEAGNVVPPRIPFILIGCGPDAFIGPTAWYHNLVASNMFNLVGFAPSRDTQKTAAVNPLLQGLVHPAPKVSNNYISLVTQLLKKHRGLLVVGVATETPTHAEIISKLIELGVNYIVVDKPFVSNIAKSREILRLAQTRHATIYVTFNHRYCEPVFALRELAAKQKPIGFEAAFSQDWIVNPPDIRQARWRFAGKYPALTDIGSHAADLAEYVLQTSLAKLWTVHMRTKGLHKLEVYDEGDVSAETRSGIRGTILFSQTDPGHADDLYVVLRFDRRSIMWRMEWNPDALFVSQSSTTNIEVRESWEQHLRGHGKLWTELKSSNGLLSKNPPGHTQGWDLMWVHLFLGIAGDILKREGFPEYKLLPAAMKIPVPVA